MKAKKLEKLKKSGHINPYTGRDAPFDVTPVHIRRTNPYYNSSYEYIAPSQPLHYDLIQKDEQIVLSYERYNKKFEEESGCFLSILLLLIPTSGLVILLLS